MEGRYSEGCDEECDCKSEHIGQMPIVAFLRKTVIQLGSHVPLSTLTLEDLSLHIVGEAKVAYFGSVILVKKDVFNLNVQVRKADIQVQMANDICYLPDQISAQGQPQNEGSLLGFASSHNAP